MHALGSHFGSWWVSSQTSDFIFLNLGFCIFKNGHISSLQWWVPRENLRIYSQIRINLKGVERILEGSLEKEEEEGEGWELHEVGGLVAMLTHLIPPPGTP